MTERDAVHQGVAACGDGGVHPAEVDLAHARQAALDSCHPWMANGFLQMSIPRSKLKRDRFKGIATGRELAAVHPGSVLLADFIGPMGITRYRVATAIGVHQRRIDEICAGKRAITADTAVRLGLAFGVDAQFWLNLQAQYDLELIQRTQGEQLAKAIHALAPKTDISAGKI